MASSRRCSRKGTVVLNDVRASARLDDIVFKVLVGIFKLSSSYLGLSCAELLAVAACGCLHSIELSIRISCHICNYQLAARLLQLLVVCVWI